MFTLLLWYASSMLTDDSWHRTWANLLPPQLPAALWMFQLDTVTVHFLGCKPCGVYREDMMVSKEARSGHRRGPQNWLRLEPTSANIQRLSSPTPRPSPIHSSHLTAHPLSAQAPYRPEQVRWHTGSSLPLFTFASSLCIDVVQPPS